MKNPLKYKIEKYSNCLFLFAILYVWWIRCVFQMRVPPTRQCTCSRGSVASVRSSWRYVIASTCRRSPRVTRPTITIPQRRLQRCRLPIPPPQEGEDLLEEYLPLNQPLPWSPQPPTRQRQPPQLPPVDIEVNYPLRLVRTTWHIIIIFNWWDRFC
jgi:hypothetical protein